MAILKAQPPDVFTAMREKESVAMAAVATEERTIARLSAGPAAAESVSRGQRLIAERLIRESTERLADAETALVEIRKELAAARAARDAQVRAKFMPEERAAVRALRQGIVALMRLNQNVIDLEDAKARALEAQSPFECGSSHALPGWLENTYGVETRVEFWERLQNIKAFLGE